MTERQVQALATAELAASAALLAWNAAINRAVPAPAYVPANLAVAGLSVLAASRRRVPAADLGLGRDRLARGLRVGLAATVPVAAVVGLGATVPATRRFFLRRAGDDRGNGLRPVPHPGPHPLRHGGGRGDAVPRVAARPAPAAPLPGQGGRGELGPVRPLACPADPGHAAAQRRRLRRPRRSGPHRRRGRGLGGRHRGRPASASPGCASGPTAWSPRRWSTPPSTARPSRPPAWSPARPGADRPAQRPEGASRRTQRKPMWVVAVSTASPCLAAGR